MNDMSHYNLTGEIIRNQAREKVKQAVREEILNGLKDIIDEMTEQVMKEFAPQIEMSLTRDIANFCDRLIIDIRRKK